MRQSRFAREEYRTINTLVFGVFAASMVAAAPAPSRADGPDEFRPLVAGDSLDGWVVEMREPRDGDPVWTVADGVVRCDGDGGFGFLRYDEELGDFRLRLEYRLSERGNSGIGIRSVPYQGERSTRPSFAAYEVQLVDDSGKPASKHSTGSLYRYVAPTANPNRPAGEWNQMEIECRGPRIKITLNGETIQDVDQSTIDKIRSKPLRGYVLLQNHGRNTEFRNVELCELAPSDAADAGS